MKVPMKNDFLNLTRYLVLCLKDSQRCKLQNRKKLTNINQKRKNSKSLRNWIKKIRPNKRRKIKALGI